MYSQLQRPLNFPYSKKLATGTFNKLLGIRGSLAVIYMVGNLAKTFLAGGILGTKALAVISLFLPVVFFKYMLFDLFLGGIITLMTKARGEGNYQEANRIFTFLFFFSTICCTILFSAFILFSQDVINFFSDDSELIEMTLQYLYLLVPFWIVQSISDGLEYAYSLDGRPVFFAVKNILKICTNAIFMFLFLVIFQFEINGVALGEVAGIIVGLLWICSHIFYEKRTVKFDCYVFSHLSQYIHYIGENFKLGLPYVASDGLKSLVTGFQNKIIAGVLGEYGLALFAVYYSIEGAFTDILWEAKTVSTQIDGLLYGEKNFQGLRWIFKHQVTIVACIGLFLSFTAILLSQQLFKMHGITEPVQLALGTVVFCIAILSQPGIYILNTVVPYLISIRKTPIALFLTTLNSILVFPIFYILSRLLGGLGCAIAIAIIPYITLASLTFLKNEEKSYFLPKTDNIIKAYSFILTPFNYTQLAELLEKNLEEFCNVSKKSFLYLPLLVEEIFIYLYKKLSATHKIINVDLRVINEDNKLKIILIDDGKMYNSPETLEHPELLRFEGINQRVLNTLLMKVSYDRILELNYLRLWDTEKILLLKRSFALQEENISDFVKNCHEELTNMHCPEQTIFSVEILTNELCMFVLKKNAKKKQTVNVDIIIQSDRENLCVTIVDNGVEYSQKEELYLDDIMTHTDINKTLLNKNTFGIYHDRVFEKNYAFYYVTKKENEL